METIFDTHSHYTDAAFDADRKKLLGSLPESGISGVVECGTTVALSRSALALAAEFPWVFAAVGIHPEEVTDLPEDWLGQIAHLAINEKCVAIGEIGLDYHYRSDNREQQKAVFASQLRLANEKKLPVIVHDREAHEDTLKLLQAYRPQGVMHCFSGSVEGAAEILGLGMYIGLGGAVTFKNARKPLEVAAAVPLDRLLLETDCPYMAPVPHRGERNDSTRIPYAAAVIAEVRGIPVEELLRQTDRNARKLFGIGHNTCI